VDYGYATTFARLCKENGVKHIHSVSSTGANSKSWFLYLKTKGEVSKNKRARTITITNN